MSTAMTTDPTASDHLPSQFVLYIPTRSTKKDPFAGYILLNANPVPTGKAKQLNAAPSIPNFETPYTLKTDTHHQMFHIGLVLNIITNMPLWVTFAFTGKVLQPPNGGTPLLVLRLYNNNITTFLPSNLKRNIAIVSADTKPTIVTTVPSPAIPPPVLTPAGGAGDPTPLPSAGKKKKPVSIPPPLTPAGGAGDPTPLPLLLPMSMTSVAALFTKPTKVKKPLKPKQPLPPPEGDLSFHVARQLLELARIRKTECPIIAEELSEGNTAAMPCGHLFSRLAIEESFKTERYRCPACRLSGMPTFV